MTLDELMVCGTERDSEAEVILGNSGSEYQLVHSIFLHMCSYTTKCHGTNKIEFCNKIRISGDLHLSHDLSSVNVTTPRIVSV